MQHQYTIKTLCRVLKVNRSTYYKHFYSKPAPRTCENQVIRKHILQIYSDYDNSLGAYKIRRILERDYGINISLGRVYRLMSTMNLPKRSTEKPKGKHSHKENGNCFNHLNQQFNPSSPNSVWASDFTYIKVNGSFHYLCVVMDLFSRKIIGWSISNRHDVDLTMKAFENARDCPNIDNFKSIFPPHKQRLIKSLLLFQNASSIISLKSLLQSIRK